MIVIDSILLQSCTNGCSHCVYVAIWMLYIRQRLEIIRSWYGHWIASTADYKL